ncbi:MAG: 50S ribosomal protein L3 [Patescibacteria group bacterium]|nr:50S ribosomal protein L3 [Patescibacteria group bacterium]
MALKQLLTRKVGMTSIIAANGDFRAVTLLSVGEHQVISKKTVENDKYNAFRVGIETVKKIRKSLKGQLKSSSLLPKYIKEFRIFDDFNADDPNVGDSINPDIFSVGDKVNVQGLSKGKGFAGTIKRHNFHRGRKTHGGRSYRRVGSIGSMYPQHILKGKKMAGRLGHTRVTIKNLEIALVETDRRIIGVYGAVPGPKKSLVLVKGMSK